MENALIAIGWLVKLDYGSNPPRQHNENRIENRSITQKEGLYAPGTSSSINKDFE